LGFMGISFIEYCCPIPARRKLTQKSGPPTIKQPVKPW
jgi:hypothetical protein